MQNKRKRKSHNFKPSISLAEFAEMEELNLFALEAAVGFSGDVHARYTRNGVSFYHISDIKHWLTNNEVAG